MSMVSGIQGQLLEVTVVGCSKLKDTEWISRQDPYVCLEYATTKFRTRTCTDGGKHPIFQEKTVIPLIEGLREIVVTVWNSNTLTFDDYIGSGRVQLQKVLSQGYDDSSWAIQSKKGKFAGEVKLIMHFPNAQKSQYPASNCSHAAPMYMGAPAPPYSQPPLGYPLKSAAASPYGQPPVGYPPSKSVAAPPASLPPPTGSVPYPAASAYPYPEPQSAPYPAAPAYSKPEPASLPYPSSSLYPQVEPASAPYPAASAYSKPETAGPPYPSSLLYPQVEPASAPYPPPEMQYPPPQQTYPPPTYPPQTYPPPQSYYPPGAYPGAYPPPPY